MNDNNLTDDNMRKVCDELVYEVFTSFCKQSAKIMDMGFTSEQFISILLSGIKAAHTSCVLGTIMSASKPDSIETAKEILNFYKPSCIDMLDVEFNKIAEGNKNE